MRRPARLSLTAAILLAGAWVAEAQEPSVGLLLHYAEGRERRGRWAEAGELYERALARGWDTPYATEDDFALRLGDEIATRIAAWPEEGWRAYQSEHGIGASAKLDAAVARGSAEEVLEIASASFVTCAGARAAMIHARRELEAGRYAEALEWASRLYRFHPALRISPPERVPSRLEVLALAILCERRLLGPNVVGEAAREIGALPRGAVVAVGGREISVEELTEACLPIVAQGGEGSVDPLALAASGAESAWEADGAGPTYARWTFPVRSPDLAIPPNMEGFAGALAPCFLSVAPTIHEGCLLAQDGSRLYCVDARQGTLRWQFPPPERVDRPKRGRRSGMHRADEAPRTVAVCGKWAITTLCLRPAEDGLHATTCFDAPLSLDLVAVGLESGDVAWSSVGWDDPTLVGACLACNPVVRDGVVYAMATRVIEGTAIARDLVAVEVEGGRLRWRVPLPAPASIEVQSGEFARKVGHCARIDEYGGRLFVLTNDGLCLCADREDGAILWRAEVQTNPFAMWSQSFRAEALFTGPSPLALVGTTLLVMPFGGGPLYALEASTGRERWRLLGEAAFLVGVSEGRAVLAGDCLTCVDVASRKTLWTFPLQGMLSGRPALAGHVAFVPLLEGIAAVEVSTGPKADAAAPGSLPLLATYQARGRNWQWRGSGGQVAVSEGRLVAFSTDGIQTWATRKGIEAEAADRIARDPKDAEAWALRADMAWAVGERARACDDYEQAARAIDPAAEGDRAALRKKALDRVYTIASEDGRQALATKPPDFKAATRAYHRALDAAREGGSAQALGCLLSLLVAARGSEDRDAMVVLLDRLRAEHPWATLPWFGHPMSSGWGGPAAPEVRVRTTQPTLWSLAEARLRDLGVVEREAAGPALAAARAEQGIQALARVAASWPETPEAKEARAEAARRAALWGNEELAADLLGEETPRVASEPMSDVLLLARSFPPREPWTTDGESLFAMEEGGVVAWNLSLGTATWRTSELCDAEGRPVAMTSLAVVAGRLIAVGNAIRGIDASTGAVLWEAEGAPKTDPVGAVLFATSERRARVIEPRTGSLLWDHAIGKGNAYPSVAWVDTRRLSDRILVWASGPVRAVDLFTGMPAYTVQASQPRPGLNLAVGGGATGWLAYAEEPASPQRGGATSAATVVCVRRRDGLPLWRWECGPEAGMVRFITASPDGDAVLVGTEDGWLHLLDPAGAGERKRYLLANRTWLPLGATAERLPLTAAEDVLVVAAQQGAGEVSIVGWDLDTGDLRWSVPFVAGPALATVAREAVIAEDGDHVALAQERVEAGRREVRVLCVSKRDGAILLREDAPFEGKHPRIALSGGRLFVQAADGLRVYGPGK